MTRGGKRKGSGRKPGAATKRTCETANKLAADGIMPLEILTKTMRKAWSDGDVELACKLADDVAPYYHARISSRDPIVKLKALGGSHAEQGIAVIAAVASGEVTPAEGACLLSAFISRAKLVEADDLVRRIEALEQRATQGSDHGKR